MDEVIYILIGIGLALVITLLVRRFLFFVAIISSNSMLPTLKPRNRVLAKKIYNYSKIKRGDIIIFYSNEYNEKMIKRVIGIPGDLVEIRGNGDLYINRNKIDEPYVHYNDGLSGAYRVPENKYFFLGDNRQQSTDSRHWEDKYISENDLTGKVIIGANRTKKK